MLVACRSFVDDDHGAVLAGVTYCDEGHELVARWGERFELSSQITDSERSALGGDLIRAHSAVAVVEEDGGAVVTGIAVPYGAECEIHELGQSFRERFAFGALAGSIRSGARYPVMLEHGRDPRLGHRPIAKPSYLREDADAARFAAELLTDDPDVRDHALPGIRAGLYGASVRFRPLRVDREPPRGGERLELRTVREAKLRELSVTSLPAYDGTTVGLAA